MFANGPQWTSAGSPSSVCTRFGFSASLSSTAIEPAAPSCSAVTGSPSNVAPTVIAPSRRAQVGEVARDGDDRHHLRGGRDVEAGLARRAVDAAAEADDDRCAARGRPCRGSGASVIECGSRPSALPCSEVRVDHRGEQVVGGADRVDVAGEVEVDLLHRHELRAPAAGAAALDPEHRAERRLAQAEQRALADPAERLDERDRGRRLALADLRRRHRRDGDRASRRARRAGGRAPRARAWRRRPPYG